MTGRGKEIIETAGIALSRLAAVLLFAATQPLAAQTGNAASDAFTQCVTQGGGETACLALLGKQFDWRPTEAACRFLAGKTEAIIAAGGDVRWRDLFYNERCARLSLPHGSAAAAAGAAIDPNHPFLRCFETILALECGEEVAQHALHPTKSMCYTPRSLLRDARMDGKLSTWYTLFDNERCWRLGLPHYEVE